MKKQQLMGGLFMLVVVLLVVILNLFMDTYIAIITALITLIAWYKFNQRNLKHGKPHVQGTEYNENGTILYEGDWKDGLPNGQGTEYDKDGRKYHEGVFKDGKMHGQGIGYYKEGTKLYEGEFEYGMPHGQGSAYREDGIIEYEGDWKYGKPNGQGIRYYKEGTKYYEGGFKDGKMHGQGTGYWPEGTIVYEGAFKYGAWHGQGTLYREDGTYYEGVFKDGKVHGRGIGYYKDGTIAYEGDFEEGNPINIEKDISMMNYNEEDDLTVLVSTGVSYAKKQTDLFVDILRRKILLSVNDKEYNEIYKIFTFLNWTYAYGVWTNIMNTEIRRDLMVKSARNMILEFSEVNKNKTIQGASYNSNEYEQEFERYRKEIWKGLQQKIREGFDADANSILFIGLEWIQDKLQLSDKNMMDVVPDFSQDTYVINSIGKIEKIACQIAERVGNS